MQDFFYSKNSCLSEPVMTAILGKDALASQPTLSRFFNRIDADTLAQLNRITRELRKVIYSIKKPEFIINESIPYIISAS